MMTDRRKINMKATKEIITNHDYYYQDDKGDND
jgi:hypothetical protein